MANVFAGYKGLAYISTVGYIRYSDANITATQEVNAPDLIMGDWDHDAYNYGPITVGGTINGPVSEAFVDGSAGGGIWDWGVKRTAPCGTLSAADIDLYYYCGTPENDSQAKNFRQFTNMAVQSLNFSCTAGDVANFSIEVIGTSAGDWDNQPTPDYQTPEKLITWDRVAIEVIGTAGHEGDLVTTALNYQSFDFTIANNIEPVYSLAQANLFPFEIVPGIRTITGTLTAYNIPQALGADTFTAYDAASVTTLRFTLSSSTTDLIIDMKVQLHRVQPASSPGVITSTIGFTGVTHQTGTAWEG